MKTISVLLTLLLFSSVLAEKSKTIVKHYPTNSLQTIELKDFFGSEVRIRSWDKNEVYIKLIIKATSSDDEWEDEYIKAADISAENINSRLSIQFNETDEKSGSSFLGIQISFFHYEKKEIFGDIFVPRDNPISTNLKYGLISLSDIKGEINLTGTSNEVEINNCINVKKIENNYGNISINNSRGNLYIKGTSATIKVAFFSGPVKIDANYASIDINDITESLEINSVSGTHNIENIGSDVRIKSNYSTIKISDIKGEADVKSTSGNITIKKAFGVFADADYATINISGIESNGKGIVTIESTSANIRGEDIKADININSPYTDIFLKSVNGNVNIKGTSSKIICEDITGNWNTDTRYTEIDISRLDSKNVTIKNSSGPISIFFKGMPESVNIENKYDGIRIKMPGEYTGEIELTTKYGSINTDFPVKKKNFGSSEYAFGKLGSRKSNVIIETQSGNIEFSKSEK